MNLITYIPICISIGSSVIRACNIGYQKETYLLSAIANFILIFYQYTLGSIPNILMNLFHMFISLWGFYRWVNYKN